MKNLLQLPAVQSGAGIGVIAPASFAQPGRIDAGLEHLRGLGFGPLISQHALERGPLFFAGTIEQRLIDLHAAFTDETTRFVMCLRGGYGSNYLLDGLDLQLIGNHPKPFFGYSDLTGLQLHLLDQLGLPAYHGPMVAADFHLEDGVHLPSFLAALAGQPYRLGAAEGLRVLKPGPTDTPVRGTLYGGCLSILVSLLGTPFEPHTEGKLLFLEDTGAKPYQVDRMIWQLRHAGKLDGVCGIVFGEMLDCVSPGASPGLLEEVILGALKDFDGPVGFGLRSGHVSRQNVTLMFGVEAELHTGPLAELHVNPQAVTK